MDVDAEEVLLMVGFLWRINGDIDRVRRSSHLDQADPVLTGDTHRYIVKYRQRLAISPRNNWSGRTMPV
jgi:hypothetical protein